MTVTRYFRREGNILLILGEDMPLRVSGDLAGSLMTHIETGDNARIDDLRTLLGADYRLGEVRWMELHHLQCPHAQR